MKRIALCILAAMLMLSGCAASQEEPFRVDTVVQIPVDPTEEPSETVTEAPTEAPTEQATEAPTEAPTEPKETTPKKTTTSSKSSGSSGKSSSSSGSSSSKNQSSSKKEPAATQPPKTTEPPATQPPKTTEPPVTVPAETTVPTVATEPPSETETEPETDTATEPSADSDIELPTEEPTVPPTEEPAALPTEAPTEPPYDPSSYGVGGLESAIVATLNAYRREAGLPELSLSGRLSGIAFIRAQEISVSWSHARPDGRSYTSVLDDYGYGYSSVSENLLYVSGGGDGAAIADRWMASDSTSAEILSDCYTAVGVGVYYAGGMTYVACLLVG